MFSTTWLYLNITDLMIEDVARVQSNLNDKLAGDLPEPIYNEEEDTRSLRHPDINPLAVTHGGHNPPSLTAPGSSDTALSRQESRIANDDVQAQAFVSISGRREKLIQFDQPATETTTSLTSKDYKGHRKSQPAPPKASSDDELRLFCMKCANDTGLDLLWKKDNEPAEKFVRWVKGETMKMAMSPLGDEPVVDFTISGDKDDSGSYSITLGSADTTVMNATNVLSKMSSEKIIKAEIRVIDKMRWLWLRSRWLIFNHCPFDLICEVHRPTGTSGEVPRRLRLTHKFPATIPATFICKGAKLHFFPVDRENGIDRVQGEYSNEQNKVRLPDALTSGEDRVVYIPPHPVCTGVGEDQKRFELYYGKDDIQAGSFRDIEIHILPALRVQNMLPVPLYVTFQPKVVGCGSVLSGCLTGCCAKDDEGTNDDYHVGVLIPPGKAFVSKTLRPRDSLCLKADLCYARTDSAGPAPMQLTEAVRISKTDVYKSWELLSCVKGINIPKQGPKLNSTIAFNTTPKVSVSVKLRTHSVHAVWDMKFVVDCCVVNNTGLPLDLFVTTKTMFGSAGKVKLAPLKQTASGHALPGADHLHLRAIPGIRSSPAQSIDTEEQGDTDLLRMFSVKSAKKERLVAELAKGGSRLECKSDEVQIDTSDPEGIKMLTGGRVYRLSHEVKPLEATGGCTQVIKLAHMFEIFNQTDYTLTIDQMTSNNQAATRLAARPEKRGGHDPPWTIEAKESYKIRYWLKHENAKIEGPKSRTARPYGDFELEPKVILTVRKEDENADFMFREPFRLVCNEVQDLVLFNGEPCPDGQPKHITLRIEKVVHEGTHNIVITPIQSPTVALVNTTYFPLEVKQIWDVDGSALAQSSSNTELWTRCAPFAVTPVYLTSIADLQNPPEPTQQTKRCCGLLSAEKKKKNGPRPKIAKEPLHVEVRVVATAESKDINLDKIAEAFEPLKKPAIAMGPPMRITWKLGVISQCLLVSDPALEIFFNRVEGVGNDDENSNHFHLQTHIGVSCVSRNTEQMLDMPPEPTKEIAFFGMKNVALDSESDDDATKYSLKVGHIHLDDPDNHGTYPVVLSMHPPLKGPTGDDLALSVEYTNNSTFSADVRDMDAIVKLAKINFTLTDDWAFKMKDFSQALVTFEGTGQSFEKDFVPPNYDVSQFRTTKEMIHIRSFKVDEIDIDISVLIRDADEFATGATAAVLGPIVAMLANIENAQVNFAPLAISHKLMDPVTFNSTVQQEYVSQWLSIIFKLLLSSSLFGNPMKAYYEYKDAKETAWDTMPNAKQGDALEGARGYCAGWCYVYYRTCLGCVACCTGFWGNCGRCCAELTYDKTYQSKRITKLKRRPKSVLRGGQQGLQTCAWTITDAIFALYRKPKKGMDRKGVPGIVFGIVKGFIQFIPKMLCTCWLDCCVTTMRGCLSTKDAKTQTRMRRPRVIKDDLLTPYDAAEAEGQFILFDKLGYDNDHLLLLFGDPSEPTTNDIHIATNTRVINAALTASMVENLANLQSDLSLKDWKEIWSIQYKELFSAEVAADGKMISLFRNMWKKEITADEPEKIDALLNVVKEKAPKARIKLPVGENIILYEFQRLVNGTWHTSNLPPTEAAWKDGKGKPCEPKETYTLPMEYVWVDSSWELIQPRGELEGEGWLYNVDCSGAHGKWRSYDETLTCRRRGWKRRKKQDIMGTQLDNINTTPSPPQLPTTTTGASSSVMHNHYQAQQHGNGHLPPPSDDLISTPTYGFGGPTPTNTPAQHMRSPNTSDMTTSTFQQPLQQPPFGALLEPSHRASPPRGVTTIDL